MVNDCKCGKESTSIKEHVFYPKVKKAVEQQFIPYSLNMDFEITGCPINKPIPKRFLDEEFLQEQKKLVTPDIMGHVWANDKSNDRKLIIVEFKLDPDFTSIYQAKKYDELFNAYITYLIGRKSISEVAEKTLKFIKKRPFILKTKNGQSTIYTKFLQETDDGRLDFYVLGNEFSHLPYDETEKILSIASNR